MERKKKMSNKKYNKRLLKNNVALSFSHKKTQQIIEMISNNFSRIYISQLLNVSINEVKDFEVIST